MLHVNDVWCFFFLVNDLPPVTESAFPNTANYGKYPSIPISNWLSFLFFLFFLNPLFLPGNVICPSSPSILGP